MSKSKKVLKVLDKACAQVLEGFETNIKTPQKSGSSDKRPREASDSTENCTPVKKAQRSNKPQKPTESLVVPQQTALAESWAEIAKPRVETNESVWNMSRIAADMENLEKSGRNKDDAGGAGTSGTQKAKFKQDEGIVLYLHRGQDEAGKAAVNAATFDQFTEKVYEDILSMDEILRKNIRLKWMQYKDGKGQILCADAETATWVKQEASSFKIEGIPSRAWSRDELGQRIVFQGPISGLFRQRRQGPRAISEILKLNGWTPQKGRFQVLTYDATYNGVYIRFQADDKLAAFLEEVGPVYSAGNCTFTLSKKLMKRESDVVRPKKAVRGKRSGKKEAAKNAGNDDSCKAN